MSGRKSYTSEKLNDRFDNPFTLVNYAISLTKERLRRDPGSETNPVIDVLEIIASGEDLLIEEDNDEQEEEAEPAS
ncbi:MAG: hypothetical protein K940chlam9_00900 [Chlamydiae bacterium]|nr:hypothetical protein [Chlamydiota bacterium]